MNEATSSEKFMFKAISMLVNQVEMCQAREVANMSDLMVTPVDDPLQKLAYQEIRLNRMDKQINEMNIEY